MFSDRNSSLADEAESSVRASPGFGTGKKRRDNESRVEMSTDVSSSMVYGMKAVALAQRYAAVTRRSERCIIKNNQEADANEGFVAIA